MILGVMVLNETLSVVSEGVAVAPVVVQQVLGVGYWLLGGAVGIAVLSFFASTYTNHRLLTSLKVLVELNREMLKELKKRR